MQYTIHNIMTHYNYLLGRQKQFWPLWQTGYYPKERKTVQILKYMGTSAIYFDRTVKNLKEANDSWGWGKEDADFNL